MEAGKKNVCRLWRPCGRPCHKPANDVYYVYIQKVSDKMIRYKTNAAAVKTVPNSACVGPHTTA